MKEYDLSVCTLCECMFHQEGGRGSNTHIRGESFGGWCGSMSVGHGSIGIPMHGFGAYISFDHILELLLELQSLFCIHIHPLLLTLL